MNPALESLVKFADWFDDLGKETIYSGRRAIDPFRSWTLEMCGSHLFYSIKLDGGWVFLSVQLLDKGEEPQFLIRLPDGAEGFRHLTRIVKLLEEEEVRSLERPIELGGGSGPNAYVIA